MIEPFVKQAVAHSSQHLKEQVEKAAPRALTREYAAATAT